MTNSKAAVRGSQTNPMRTAWRLEDAGHVRTTSRMKSPISMEPMRFEG